MKKRTEAYDLAEPEHASAAEPAPDTPPDTQPALSTIGADAGPAQGELPLTF